MSVGPIPALLKSGAGFAVAARFARRRTALTTLELIRYVSPNVNAWASRLSRRRTADERTVIDAVARGNAIVVHQVSAEYRVLGALLIVDPPDADMIVLRNRIAE